MTDSIYDPFMHIPQSVFFILVMEHHWQSSQKGFSIAGNKLLENSQNNRKSGIET
jgi:hypothetical protein